ncbi:MAG TPA: hypothetical protein VNQ90_04565 [Chthoniobacteraceae bacterium]|nr:hypothetical protein [Chthoniobacteraceae bacterium]
MKLPLKTKNNSSQIPEGATCLICNAKIGEIEGFIRLTTGAILYCDKKRDTGGPSDKMDTVFSLYYHGPHPVIGMNHDECYLNIVEPVRGGQVDLHFCSTSCLSTFFASIVHQFDHSIKSITRRHSSDG